MIKVEYYRLVKSLVSNQTLDTARVKNVLQRYCPFCSFQSLEKGFKTKHVSARCPKPAPRTQNTIHALQCPLTSCILLTLTTVKTFQHSTFKVLTSLKADPNPKINK